MLTRVLLFIISVSIRTTLYKQQQLLDNHFVRNIHLLLFLQYMSFSMFPIHKIRYLVTMKLIHID